MFRSALLALLALLVAFACAAPAEPPPPEQPAEAADAGELPDASEPPDAGSKAAACATTFGSELTNAFGRLDGVVTAVVTPADTQCTMPNNDHVVVQVQSHGAVYRMVVNVQSSFGDPDVRFATVEAPLPGDAWSDGWHPTVTLDYVTSLSLHSTNGPFTPVPMGALVQKISDAVVIGQEISVYATSSGGSYAHSAHLIHRNGSGHDGAMVLAPRSAHPKWMVFHFANQTF